MASVRELIEAAPPEILYHYTRPQGLLGIVENKEIWASHTQFLNDQQEFRHAIKIIKEELAKLIDEKPAHRQLFDEMNNVLGQTRESLNICVCSFSENGDVLSQWRAYGGGSGFSMGFRGGFLKRVCEREEVYLVKCIYDEPEQRRVMRLLLLDVLNELLIDGRPPRDRLHGGNLGDYLSRYAPILKHESFREEREWRIICGPYPSTNERFNYRPGPTLLIPYFKLPLHAANDPFQLHEVIIGPTPHSRQSRWSMQTFLAKHGYRDTKIDNTKAPYRNW